MHVSKSSPAQAAIAHRSIADEQESTATWPTLASRKHSLLGLDSTETDGEYGGTHRQENAESTQISERLAAARAWCRIAISRFSRSYGPISSLDVAKPREKETERTPGILDRPRDLWRWWLFADFYRVQLPVLLGSLLLWSLSFLGSSRETSFSFPVSHSTANQDRLQRDPRRVLSVSTQHQGTSRTPLARGWIEQISASLQLDKIIDFFYSSSPKSKIQGKSDVVVWADTRTGLYYCRGEKARGNRTKGRYISQQQAQRLSFEPADRRPCQ